MQATISSLLTILQSPAELTALRSPFDSTVLRYARNLPLCGHLWRREHGFLAWRNQINKRSAWKFIA